MTGLDDLQAKAEAATPGPWEADDIYGLVAPTQIDGFAFPMDRQEAEWAIRADADFIAASRDAVPRLVRALEAVLAITAHHTGSAVSFQVENAIENALGREKS